MTCPSASERSTSTQPPDDKHQKPSNDSSKHTKGAVQHRGLPIAETTVLGLRGISETHDHSGGIQSRTEATRRRPLASPVTLRQADTGTGFLVYGNLPPARLRLRSHHPRIQKERP